MMQTVRNMAVTWDWNKERRGRVDEAAYELVLPTASGGETSLENCT